MTATNTAGVAAASGAGGTASSAAQWQGMSMKQKLAKWRAQNQAAESSVSSSTKAALASDGDLVRDAIFLLQGIDGRHSRFMHAPSINTIPQQNGLPVHPLERYRNEESNASYLLTFEPSSSISAGDKDLLRQIAQRGNLYRESQTCIHRLTQSANLGMTQASLCQCLQEELGLYDQHIAQLEASRTAAAAYDIVTPSAKPTLRQLILSTRPFQCRLTIIQALATTSTQLSGGKLLSHIHELTSCGDPGTRQFAEALLARVSLPFFMSLSSWIGDGELVDHSDEFFVSQNPSSGRNGDDDQKRIAWSGLYGTRMDMLPSFVGEGLGQKIYSTGRSLNYIKYACSDGAWVIDQRNDKSTRSCMLDYKSLKQLESRIDVAHAQSSKRLFNNFFTKFGLLQHLRALKDYMLLGRGDFVEMLIEQLGPQLNKPANNLYRHHLTTILDTTVRALPSTSPQTDLLNRLDARMLDFSAGELGWDVFTLEYKVDSPVDVILDSESMEIYGRLFSHLWQVKRVEHSLNETWKRVMGEARWYNRVIELQPDFQNVRVILAEMIHFVRQLQYFSHLEVIECSWSALEAFALRMEGDLDALVEAHQLYISRLLSKLLLRGITGSSATRSDDRILQQVQEAFRVILQFKETVDALCNYALAEAARLDDTQIRGMCTKAVPQQRPGSSASIRTTASATSQPTPLPPSNPEQLAQLRRRVQRYGAQFGEAVLSAVTALAKHQDLDLRFLSCRLNFSFFYIEGRKAK